MADQGEQSLEDELGITIEDHHAARATVDCPACHAASGQECLPPFVATTDSGTDVRPARSYTGRPALGSVHLRRVVAYLHREANGVPCPTCQCPVAISCRDAEAPTTPRRQPHPARVLAWREARAKGRATDTPGVSLRPGPEPAWTRRVQEHLREERAKGLLLRAERAERERDDLQRLRGEMQALVDALRSRSEAAEASERGLRHDLQSALESGTSYPSELVAQARKWRSLAKGTAEQINDLRARLARSEREADRLRDSRAFLSSLIKRRIARLAEDLENLLTDIGEVTSPAEKLPADSGGE